MLEKEHDLDQLKAAKKTKSVVGELGPFGGIRPSNPPLQKQPTITPDYWRWHYGKSPH
jgi:hypothetical protein